MRLKCGDEVLVHKPKNVRESPVWIPAMNEFDGKIMTVSYVGVELVKLEGTRYSFNTKWLTPLESLEYTDLEKFAYDMNDLM